MAFLPFIPLVIQAAIGSAGAIARNRQNRKQYDFEVRKFTAQWEAQEKQRLMRAGIIQRLIDSDPKLKEAAAFLGPDFWTQVMTSQPVPKNYFPDRPRGGITGDLISGHLGGLQIQPESVKSAFDQLRENNSYPDVSQLGKPKTASMDGGGGGSSLYQPPDWESNTPEFTTSGGSSQGGGFGSNIPDSIGSKSIGAPKPPVTPAAKSDYSPPPVLSGLGLRFDPTTGQVVDKFGGTVEF